ncbi:MAG: MFS transporter [Pseudomonadota bacterium]|nr:MFS transporter [Pseudomonadota bacterium]
MARVADTAEIQAGDRLARRNARILAAASALGSANASIVVATGGLVGQAIAPAPALATAPVTAFVSGTAVAAIPAALLMKRFGRRTGFMAGTLVGIVAGLLAALSVRRGLFSLFVLATFLAGFYGAFVQQYRFAAADTASDAFRPRAISWVLAGGVLAGVIGPQTVIHTAYLLPPFTFLASYLAQAGLALLSLGLLAFLEVPPPPAASASRSSGRPLREIAANPRFLVAVLCAVASYVLMNFVMTASPLAMVGCGHSVSDSTLAIQWHVIAMFAPSFFTGTLIARFGKTRVVAFGFVLLAGCGIVALAGLTLAHFWTALVLLGIGWNFSFVGATAMLTDTYKPEERAKVQAANDFAVFASVALGSLSAGAVFTAAGWSIVNLVLFPGAALCLAALAWLTLQRRPAMP